MRACKTFIFQSALAICTLMAAEVRAKQESIANEDLLNLLEKVNQEQAPVVQEPPVEDWAAEAAENLADAREIAVELESVAEKVPVEVPEVEPSMESVEELPKETEPVLEKMVGELPEETEPAMEMMVGELPEETEPAMEMMVGELPEETEPAMEMMVGELPEETEPVLEKMVEELPEETKSDMEVIEDQDLLSLIEKVNQDLDAPVVQEQPVESPVLEVAASLADTQEVVVELEPAMEKAPVEFPEIELAMESVEELPKETEPATEAVAEELPEGMEVDDLVMGSPDLVGSGSENLISVRLNKVGLEEAINLFAQLSGANIIVPELADAAQISVNLKDVEWRPALQSILDTYNYELYQRVSGSNVYSVRLRPDGAPEPQVVETFLLEYATVPNVVKLVRELLPADAKVSEFASRNMIVIKSTESSLGEVRAVLSSIDKVRQQVFIESKFMELTDDAQKDLGIDWQALTSYGVEASGNSIAYGKEISTDTPSENLWQDLVSDGSASLAGSGEYAVMTSVLNADQFNVVLSAMENNKGVNVVSNPKIIVANEELANISIIRKEPNLKQSRQQALNDTPDTITFELDEDRPFFDFGIKLDVLPSINTSNNITVKINPSLTRKFADKVAGDNTYPVIDEKSIQTVFSLASGQTAAIGGLTEVTESEEEHKVPVLGSIPFMGRFFSWKQTVHGQDETIIFVTVGLADTQEIDSETGMPADSELARRQVIKDRTHRALREQDRKYYEAEQDDKLDDMLRVMTQEERKRLEKRDRVLQKEANRTVSSTF